MVLLQWLNYWVKLFLSIIDKIDFIKIKFYRIIGAQLINNYYFVDFALDKPNINV